ncbi:MAG TPA: hypothetical protein VD994_04815 [Prosthecobacter sp.]|nr:hypothetical protein [Prosthecobacter sp.]
MNKREQILAIGLGVAVIAGGAFLGLTQLKTWKQKVDQRSLSLDTRQLEAEELLSEKDLWEQRSAWLAEKQPEFTKRSEADLTMLNLIRDTAGSHDVTIDQIQPQTPNERLSQVSSTYQVQVTADLAAILKWLHAIQEPNSFIDIPALTMIPNDQDTAKVTVSMTIQKWFRLPPA